MAAVVQATGRVVRDALGLEVIVQRRLPVGLEEAWEWVTAPAKLKQWIGVLKGRPGVGATVQLQMTAEDGKPTSDLHVVECEPLRRYVVEQRSDDETWRLRISLAETGAGTTIFLGHRVDDWRAAGMFGPGWEYYLDRLVAAHGKDPMPDFDEYFPQQRPYFERLALDGDPVAWPVP